MKIPSLIGLVWLALASGPTLVRAESSATQSAGFDALRSDDDSDEDSDDDSDDDSDRKKGRRHGRQRGRDRTPNADMCLDRDRNRVCDTTDRTTDRRRDRRDRDDLCVDRDRDRFCDTTGRQRDRRTGDDVCIDRDRDGRCDAGVSRGSIGDILGSIMRGGGQFRTAMSQRMP